MKVRIERHHIIDMDGEEVTDSVHVGHKELNLERVQEMGEAQLGSYAGALVDADGEQVGWRFRKEDHEWRIIRTDRPPKKNTLVGLIKAFAP